MKLGCKKILGYPYRHNAIQTREENWEKVKKNPRGHTKVGIFKTITHRTKKINKPGHAK